MVPKWRRINVDATSSRRIDVDTASFYVMCPLGRKWTPLLTERICSCSSGVDLFFYRGKTPFPSMANSPLLEWTPLSKEAKFKMKELLSLKEFPFTFNVRRNVLTMSSESVRFVP